MSVDTRTHVHFTDIVPQFTVPDLVRTVTQYRDVFGFTVDGYWDGERATDEPHGRPVFAIVHRDGVQIYFSQGDGSEVRTGRGEDANDLYFHVRGVDALATDLRGQGADILDGPEDRSYGQRELVVRDCNGLILTFAEARG